jgi:hypothetical protein
LRIVRKGGVDGRTVLSAPVVRSLEDYIGDREHGPIFITSSGRRMPA